MMANIREELTLVDNFSSSYQTFINMSESAAKGAEQVEKATKGAEAQAKGAGESMKGAGRGAKSAGESMKGMGENAKGAGESMKGAGQKFRGAGEDAQKAALKNNVLTSSLRRIIATAGGLAVVKGIVGLSDDLSQTTARLNLMNDGLQTTAQLNDMIFQAAQRARTPYQTLADSVSKMGLNAGQAFNSNQEMIQFMENISKQFAIGGASATDMQYALIQLTQAMGSGALRGDELNSILDAAPGIARNIEKSMGWASGSIKQYAEQGLVTAEVVKNAMLESTDEINRQFKQMPMTFAQAATLVKNQARQSFAPIGQMLSQAINSDAFMTGMDAVGSGIYVTLQGVAGAAEMAGNGIKWIGDNLSWIAPIIGTIAGLFLAYNAALLINNGLSAASAAIMAAKAGVQAVHAASMMMSAGATFAATAAQYGFNAALLACPITWIVAGVILLVGAIFAASGAFNQLANTGNTAIGTIVGVVYGAGAVISNIFAMIANTAIGAAEWLVNTWNEGVYEVQLFFYDLAVGAVEAFNSLARGAAAAANAVANVFISAANAAIKGINWIIEALNKIPDVNIDKMGEIGPANITADPISTDFIKRPEAPKKVSFDRYETTSIGDAWSKGFAKGSAKGNAASEKISDTFKNLTKGYGSIKDVTKGAGGYPGVSKGAGSGTGGKGGTGDGGKGKKGNVGSVDKVKSVGGDISLADEDVKIFRDLAERKYINNIEVKTMAPQVNATVNNNGKTEAGIGSVVKELIAVIEEESNSRTKKAHA